MAGLKSIAGRLAGAAGLLFLQAGPAEARSVEAAQAPAEWIRYAEGATQAIAGWLQGEDETALRVRTHLESLRPAADQPFPPLALKVWLDPKSVVTRVEFAPFADEAVNADLRGLILGKVLPGAVPRKMLLPLRLSIQLAPQEEQPAA